MAELTLEKYKEAYRRLRIRKEKRAFIGHMVAYAAVNTFLAAFNLLFTPGVLWFVFPLAGWGIGLASHYFDGVRMAAKHIREEEATAERMVGQKHV